MYLVDIIIDIHCKILHLNATIEMHWQSAPHTTTLVYIIGCWIQIVYPNAIKLVYHSSEMISKLFQKFQDYRIEILEIRHSVSIFIDRPSYMSKAFIYSTALHVIYSQCTPLNPSWQCTIPLQITPWEIVLQTFTIHFAVPFTPLPMSECDP